MNSRAAPQPLLDSPWLLHPHPGTDSPRCWSIPSPPTLQNADAPKLTPYNHGGTAAAAPKHSLHREVFPASQAASLLHSPGKCIWKRQPGRAPTTPGELSANSVPRFAKAAIPSPGVSRLSLQERCSSHCPSRLSAAPISAWSNSRVDFFAKQKHAKSKKKTHPSHPQLTAPRKV